MDKEDFHPLTHDEIVSRVQWFYDCMQQTITDIGLEILESEKPEHQEFVNLFAGLLSKYEELFETLIYTETL